MQFLIPLKKYNIFLGPIKTSLIEHFKGEAVVEASSRPLKAAPPARPATMFTNSENQPAPNGEHPELQIQNIKD